MKILLALIASLGLTATQAQAFLNIGVCPSGSGICVNPGPSHPYDPDRDPEYRPDYDHSDDDEDRAPWDRPRPDSIGFRERISTVILRACERGKARTWADLWEAVDKKMTSSAPRSQRKLWNKLPYEEQLKLIKKFGKILC